MNRFPVGGPRAAVHDYLIARGFKMSTWSDKEWSRADGITISIYGAGSRARLTRVDRLIADGALDEVLP